MEGRKLILLICILLLIQSEKEEKLSARCLSKFCIIVTIYIWEENTLKKISKMNKKVIQSSISTSSSCHDTDKAQILTLCGELWDMVELAGLEK